VIIDSLTLTYFDELFQRCCSLGSTAFDKLKPIACRWELVAGSTKSPSFAWAHGVLLMGMSQKDLSEYKRKHDIFRHHAWAGTALLSVLLAVRGRRAGLSRIEESHHVSEQLEREKTQAQVEK